MDRLFVHPQMRVLSALTQIESHQVQSLGRYILTHSKPGAILKDRTRTTGCYADVQPVSRKLPAGHAQDRNLHD